MLDTHVIESEAISFCEAGEMNDKYLSSYSYEACPSEVP